jgi:hypothetical protein
VPLLYNGDINKEYLMRDYGETTGKNSSWYEVGSRLSSLLVAADTEVKKRISLWPLGVTRTTIRRGEAQDVAPSPLYPDISYVRGKYAVWDRETVTTVVGKPTVRHRDTQVTLMQGDRRFGKVHWTYVEGTDTEPRMETWVSTDSTVQIAPDLPENTPSLSDVSIFLDYLKPIIPKDFPVGMENG